MKNKHIINLVDKNIFIEIDNSLCNFFENQIVKDLNKIDFRNKRVFILDKTNINLKLSKYFTERKINFFVIIGRQFTVTKKDFENQDIFDVELRKQLTISLEQYKFNEIYFFSNFTRNNHRNSVVQTIFNKHYGKGDDNVRFSYIVYEEYDTFDTENGVKSIFLKKKFETKSDIDDKK